MDRLSDNSEIIQSNGALGAEALRLDSFECRGVLDEGIPVSMLYSNIGVEIGMVTHGVGVHKILGRAIPCRAGDVFIVNSNVPHRYFAGEDGTLVAVRRILFEPKEWLDVEMADASCPRFCYGIFSGNPITVYAMLTKEVTDRIVALCNEMERELSEKRSEWHTAVKADLSLIMIALKRYVNTSLKNVPTTDPATWDPVSAAIALVNESYSDSGMTLRSIADSLYVSESHLSRLFKQVTGESFSSYLKRVRLARACALLEDTDETVESIMKICGMRDATSFYRLFGEHTGVTPNQYRKKHNKGDARMNILTEISENLQKGRAKLVKELVQNALDEGIGAETILTEGLLSGMSVVGERFKNNEVYVPEVLVAARAMNMGTEVLKPHLTAGGMGAKGRVCIGTVRGDLHDIGKTLVKMMMEGKGLEVIDLGTDVSPECFVETAIEQECKVICCSALLTTTMSVMERVVKLAEEKGIRDRVKIMVGGAPVNEEFCRAIGADCYTVDAASAAEAAVEFCKE